MFFRKRQRARLRRMMRGYQALKQSGRLDQIAALKRALTETPLGPAARLFSRTVMGQGAESGEIVVRQYLLSRVAGVSLNRAVLVASGARHGRVAYHLPKQWREIVSRNGFEVAHFRCAVLWGLYVFAQFVRGVARVARTGFASVRSVTLEAQPHVYFADLTAANLPRVVDGALSHDVVSWYLQWPGRVKGIAAVRHNVADAPAGKVNGIAIVGCRGPMPVLAGLGAAVRYSVWGLRATVIAAFDCLRGRWWHALLLNEAALAAYVRASNDEALAREYLFHNSEWMYRPLWTYEAERLGSAITFYFYSTNCEAFKKPSGYPEPGYGWKAMNWSRYLVWNEHQAEFVRRAAGAKADISVVGPISFQSGAAALPSLPPSSVAVFDVQPVRPAFYRSLALDFDYYTPQTANPFLEDICRIARDHGVSVALKRKRQIGKLAHSSYRRCVENLERLRNFIAVDPDVSALRLIDECSAVISAPFTSTALLGREMGKPSIYYDPHGVLQKEDRAAHGIAVVRGPQELERWLGEVLAKVPAQRVQHA